MAAGLESIRDVAERHLCTGCGVCAYLQPEAIRMVDDLDHGRRPLVEAGAGTREALAACPGVGLAHRPEEAPAGRLRELEAEWGPVLEVWEGYASDPELRHAASSGGAASALALYAVERGGMHGVLHIAARPDVPYLNRTVLSRTRAELLAATGSRYAPASPCDGLREVEEAPGACVFIGKPCDVAGADAARRVRPRLDARLGLTIGIFCAGTPSTRGTLEMLRRLGADPARVASVRYRGLGWPGRAVVEERQADGTLRRASLSYEESWGEVLQVHRQWRCYVCADHTGEFADVAVGDPWYRPLGPDEPGQSLVLVRTERGRRLVAAAVAAGYLTLEPRAPGIVAASQPNLLRTRGAVWGRILALRLLGAASPRYRRLPMAGTWWRVLTARQKLSSLLGTARRVFRKGLRRRVPVRPWAPGEER